MAESQNTLDITILGRTYKVACADGERDALLRTAAYLDAKMAEIRNAGKVSGTERIAVMAALNIAHELQRARKEARAIRSEPAAPSVRSASGAIDDAAARRRIVAMQSAIDQALAGFERS